MNGLGNKSMQLPFQLLIFLFLYFALVVVQHVLLSQGCLDVERTALLTFKSLLQDPSNRLSSWKEGNCCNWHGIKCSNDSLHVIRIDLRNRDYEIFLNKHSFGLSEPDTSLKGPFSTSLFNLIHLEYIDLGFNNFQGSQIPPQISNLKRLIHLDLSNSMFSGSIETQFTNLSFIEYLDISSSPIISSSSIKASSLNWVRGLAKLEVLKLKGVDLYEASSSKKNFIEPLSSLSDLKNLDISYCKLQGAAPYLPQLEVLDISGNMDLHVHLALMFERGWPKLRNLSVSESKVNGLIPSSVSSYAPLLASLDLSSNSIAGSIPSSIFKLRNLQFLSLSKNHLQGPIPKSICEISSLIKLDLSSNNITGTIPSCVNKLQNLHYFDISSNSIGGVVLLVDWIDRLNLSTIILNSNNLTVVLGTHHPSKFNIESLELRSCNLTGYIPTFICKMTHLDTLDLSDNHLLGHVPPCLGKFKSITRINLSRNNLSGTLPHLLDFATHPLMEMNFSYNNFHGPLPLPPKTVIFDLSQNNFSGEISIEIGKRLSNSKYISLSGNNLTGSIPFSICSNEYMPNSPASIDLSDNNLSWVIPSSIGYCSGLLSLNLGLNNLSGSVPNELEQAKGLRSLQLNNNNLNGAFPSSIKELKDLEFLNLGENNFEGTIPSFIGSIFGLKVISLKSNRFKGNIPTEITYLQDLQILDLSNNYLSGVIPRNISNFKVISSPPPEVLKTISDYMYIPSVELQITVKGALIKLEHLYNYFVSIDLSCNLLDGNIPEEIGQLKGLVILNLSHNKLCGVIPPSFGNLTHLEYLDLSFNRLCGEIPESLLSLSFLSSLNLSYNNLGGRIPRGQQIQTFPTSSFMNNSLFCGFPIDLNDYIDDGHSCVYLPNEHPCQCESTYKEDDRQDDAKEKLVLYGLVALGFVIGFWAPFFIMLLKKEKWWFGYWRFIDSIVARMNEFCVTK